MVIYSENIKIKNRKNSKKVYSQVLNQEMNPLSHSCFQLTRLQVIYLRFRNRMCSLNALLIKSTLDTLK